MDSPLTPEQLALFRARQKSRSRALAAVLGALVVLFFAITVVKIAKQTENRASPPTSVATQES